MQSDSHASSMRVDIIATHNPQDFYEGIEPDELVIKDTCEIHSPRIIELIEGGYQVIIAI